MKKIELKAGAFQSDIEIYGAEDRIDIPGTPGKRLVVYTETTEELFSPGNEEKVVLPDGEEHKNWVSVETILRRCVGLEMGRDDLIVAVGGGVLCDTAAFAASVYMRGCILDLVPTTHLAMVDAAVGGKTGINFMGYKNMVGTFYPAGKVSIYPAALSSLSDREYLCGLAETIKHACLGDRELFDLLENRRDAVLARSPSVLEEMLGRSIAVKVDVVRQDLREAGKRASLNLGHTFAHALESVYELSGQRHGEAVAWGILRAMELGLRLGISDERYAERVKRLLFSYGFPSEYELPVESFISALRQDKKKRGGEVRFVLQKNLGETVFRNVDEEVLREVLRK